MIKIQLADHIINADTNSKGLLKPPYISKEYRVIGLNPVIKAQRIIIVNGEQELTEEVITITPDIKSLLRAMFPNREDNYVWIGKF